MFLITTSAAYDKGGITVFLALRHERNGMRFFQSEASEWNAMDNTKARGEKKRFNLKCKERLVPSLLLGVSLNRHATGSFTSPRHG